MRIKAKTHTIRHRAKKVLGFRLILSMQITNQFGCLRFQLMHITKQFASLRIFPGQPILAGEGFHTFILKINVCNGLMHSHAYQTGNGTLMSHVSNKPSVIRHLAMAELLTVAGVVLIEAQNLPAAELLQAGIGPEDLSTIQNLIAELKEVNTGPKEAIIDRAGVTEKLGALFAESRAIVKNTLDKLAPQFKRKAPEFYRRYKAARGTRYKGKNSPKTETVTEPEVPAR